MVRATSCFATNPLIHSHKQPSCGSWFQHVKSHILRSTCLVPRFVTLGLRFPWTRVFEGCLSSAAAVQRTPCGRSSRSITRQIFNGPHFSRTAGRKNMQLICQRKMWNLTWWFWETKENNFSSSFGNPFII